MGGDMNAESTNTYIGFFDDQIAKTAELQRQRIASSYSFVVILGTLLAFLESPPSVWIGVAILYTASYIGMRGVRAALNSTTSALKDLSELASFVKEARTREDVARWALAHVKADDSNVPEAVRDLCSIQGSASTTRVAANAAFTQPASQLSRTHFLRTALVLGGLFGTVFFFAVELGNDALLTGSLKTLLPGLKGALACTLTGILGSLSLGYFASEIDGLIERSIWETEAFLGGPIAAILQTTPEVEAVNEVQLWSLLLNEVKKLRTDTTESYAKLATDAASYAVALQNVSSQLTELPAIQVPAQLANLQTVVQEFNGGVGVLDKAVTSLVNAVGAVGLFFPATTVERLDGLARQLEANQNATTSQIGSFAHSVEEGNRQAIAAFSGLSSTATTTLEKLGSLEVHVDTMHREEAEALRLLALGVNESNSSVAAAASQLGNAAKQISSMDGRLEQMSKADGVRETQLASLLGLAANTATEIANVGGALAGVVAGMSAPANGHSPTFVTPSDSGSQVSNAIAAMTGAQAAFKVEAARLDAATADLQGVRGTMERLFASIEGFQSVTQWHVRASNAPLMKLLLFPFRFSRRDSRRSAP
jgi:hypothetical protein